MKIVLKPYWKREDGFAATTTAIILAGVAAATSAAGAITTGMAQKSAANYNAKIAENNALASTQAADAEAALIAQKNRRVKGAQIAAVSAAGLDINSDSASDVIYDSAVSGELDRLTALYKGKVGATSYRSQAQLDKLEGNNASISGFIGAGSSLLSGAAQGYAINSAAKQNPTFGDYEASGDGY